MKLSPLARELYDEIAQLTIIDAHEHLPTEAEYLAFGYSGPNMFAGGYIQHDLGSAGMSPEFKATLRDGGDRPVETWWPEIRPYWEHVKYTTFSKALRLSARDLFGIPDINDDSIHEFAERVKADNTPGLYGRALQEQCKIRYAITCIDRADFPNDPVLRGITQLVKVDRFSKDALDHLAERSGREVRTLDDATEAVQALLRKDRSEGAVGFKMKVASYGPPDTAAAVSELKELQHGASGNTSYPALQDYLFHKSLDVAAKADVPVAVHTGYWGDFRDLDPKLMFSYAAGRQDVQFDMFHLGMPMVRDAALIGKNLPNVTLNLTWCPIISQIQTARMLDEMIDLVPLNKIIAFGGDYRVAVQKAYGHLVLTREAVASVLADRIDAGDFDRERALHIAKLWFHDNPARIYGLGE